MEFSRGWLKQRPSTQTFIGKLHRWIFDAIIFAQNKMNFLTLFMQIVKVRQDRLKHRISSATNFFMNLSVNSSFHYIFKETCYSCIIINELLHYSHSLILSYFLLWTLVLLFIQCSMVTLNTIETWTSILAIGG